MNDNLTTSYVEEIEKPLIILTLTGAYMTIDDIKIRKEMYYTPPLTDMKKIDRENEQIKTEILHKLEYITHTLKHIAYRLEQLPLTQKVIDIYLKLDTPLLRIDKHATNVRSMYLSEYFFYLIPKGKKNTYKQKRKNNSILNKSKRELNKAIKELENITTKIGKIEETTRTPTRIVLNSNNWVEGIIENRYKRAAATPEAAAPDKLPTVEEKKKLKEKIKNQI